MIWIWLGIIITLILIELTTNKLVSIFYVVSAFISFILAIFIDSFLIEFLVFMVLGTILLFTTRDYLFKLIKKSR